MQGPGHGGDGTRREMPGAVIHVLSSSRFPPPGVAARQDRTGCIHPGGGTRRPAIISAATGRPKYVAIPALRKARDQRVVWSPPGSREHPATAAAAHQIRPGSPARCSWERFAVERARATGTDCRDGLLQLDHGVHHSGLVVIRTGSARRAAPGTGAGRSRWRAVRRSRDLRGRRPVRRWARRRHRAVRAGCSGRL